MRQIFNNTFAQARRELPLTDVLAKSPVQREQFLVGRP